MWNKKGFTLIELLAVIVILAVIALIATPLIMNTIEDAKKGAAKNSVYGIIAAGELKHTKDDSAKDFNHTVTYTERSGLEYKGSKVNKFVLQLDKNGKSLFQGFVDGFCFVKQFEDRAVQIDESKKTASTCVTMIVPESFETDSWETIIKAVKEKNTSVYKIGDRKEISLEGLGNFTIRIANNSTPTECGQSGFSESACGFVIEFEDIITTHRINESDTNAGGWSASEVRSYLNDELLNAFPEVLRNHIIDTTVVSGHGNMENTNLISTDKIYLLSIAEIYGKENISSATVDDSAKEVTRQLDYYKEKFQETNDYSSAIKTNINGNATLWWLRSANALNNRSFYLIHVRGDWRSWAASGNNAVAPAFRLG